MRMQNQMLDTLSDRDHGHPAELHQAFEDDQAHERSVTQLGWRGFHNSELARHGEALRGDDVAVGPIVRQGDLNLLLLVLIEQQPRAGQEMFHMIEEMFQGHYPSSPFAIHHSLTQLLDIGYAEMAIEYDHPTLYSMTETGRAFLGENRDLVEAVAERTLQSARMVAKRSASKKVHKAMHELRRALLMGSERDKPEAQHVADVLERATKEIIAGVSSE